MACERCGSSGVVAGECACTELSTAQSGSLIESLGCAVDAIRNIKTQLGARQYEVWLVWSRWTGGERGAGEEYVFREVQLLPTPKVQDLAAVRQIAESLGRIEEGDIEIAELSPKLSEGELLGLIDDFEPGEDVNFYWEVLSPPREGQRAIRRRFFPTSAPVYEPTKFQWRIRLVRAHGDRTPRGLPRRSPDGVVRG